MLWNPLDDLFDFYKLAGSQFVGPPADVYESDDRLTVEIELPGINSEEVSITLDKNILIVKGTKTVKKVAKEIGYWRSERTNGSFSRSFTLPSSIDTEEIQASYDKGVLKIEINKKPEVVPRKITIKSTG